MKASCCARHSKSPNIAKSLSGIASRVNSSSIKGTGAARLAAIPPSDGAEDPGDKSNGDSLRTSEFEANEESRVGRALSGAARKGRRSSIEGLLSLFKGSSTPDPKKKSKKTAHKAKQARESSSHEIERQLTIKKDLKNKRELKGGNKERRSSIGSIKKSLSKALGFQM